MPGFQIRIVKHFIMNILRRAILKFRETKWRYYLTGSTVRSKGTLKLGKNVSIIDSNVYIDRDSILEIGDNVKIENLNIALTNNSQMSIGEYCLLGESKQGGGWSEYIINDGKVSVADHVMLKCQRLWVRFKGELSIGCYTNINRGSEIRADESVSIGAYVQCSYNVRIWDTNTHNILPPESRINLTIDKFPFFGYEYKRPSTSPVLIGNNVWIGEKASILKGCKIDNNAIVGYNTLLIGTHIPEGFVCTNKLDYSIREIKYVQNR